MLNGLDELVPNILRFVRRAAEPCDDTRTCAASIIIQMDRTLEITSAAMWFDQMRPAAKEIAATTKNNIIQRNPLNFTTT